MIEPMVENDPMTVHPMKRLGVLAAMLGTAVGFSIARRHRRLQTVAPELRHRQLYVPMSLRNDFTLRVGRHLPNPAATIAAGVDVHAEHLTGAAGQPDVRLLVAEPTGRTEPSGGLIWIHGGGFVMGTADAAQERCSRFAADLGIVVVSVDYRLAPEHPFPAGLEDCHAALVWTHQQADRLGIDPTRIAVGGDSAGGGLAACLAQLAHDRGGPPICFQLLQYPMLDDRTALRTDVDAIVWTNRSNRYAWSAYLGHRVGESETRPHAVASRRDDLTGLPPAWIGVGDIDLFHDENVDYAGRLRAAGVQCELHSVPGMYHGAEHVAPTAPSMRAFLDAMTAALRSSAVMPADQTSTR
jgi:acetyl esterase/lipase